MCIGSPGLSCKECWGGTGPYSPHMYTIRSGMGNAFRISPLDEPANTRPSRQPDDHMYSPTNVQGLTYSSAMKCVDSCATNGSDARPSVDRAENSRTVDLRTRAPPIPQYPLAKRASLISACVSQPMTAVSTASSPFWWISHG